MRSCAIMLALGVVVGHARQLEARSGVQVPAFIQQAQPGPRAADSVLERRLFTAHTREAVDLLADLFREKKVLILSSTNHNADYFQILLPLLEQVGMDSTLQYVVSERDQVIAPTLEALSLAPVSANDLVTQLPTYAHQGFCLGQEGTADLTRLLPLLQRLNAHRPAGNKVRFTGVDGGQVAWVVSPLGREEGTAVVFAELWQGLGLSGKAIVTYNSAHIEKGSQVAGGNWLTRFLTRHPEARSQLAIVELNHGTPPRYIDSLQGIRLAALGRLPEWKAYAERHRYDAIVWAPPTPYPDEGQGLWSALENGKPKKVDSIKPLSSLPAVCSAEVLHRLAQAWSDSVVALQARLAAPSPADRKPAGP